MITKTKALNRFVKWKTAALTALAAAALASTPALAGNKDDEEFKFDMVRNKQFDLTNPNFAPNARGRVKIESVGPVEIMKVKVWGLPPNTDFDLFVIQVPNAPFGEAWYQGDIETNQNGVGYGEFIGRFNIETFIVSNGSNVPAPADPFDDPNRIPDARENFPIAPIQIYHLGLWFNSPADAAAAGGPRNVTPFNGEHNAGVQVLNTSNFLPPASDFGPLHHVSS